MFGTQGRTKCLQAPVRRLALDPMCACGLLCHTVLCAFPCTCWLAIAVLVQLGVVHQAADCTAPPALQACRWASKLAAEATSTGGGGRERALS